MKVATESASGSLEYSRLTTWGFAITGPPPNGTWSPAQRACDPPLPDDPLEPVLALPLEPVLALPVEAVPVEPAPLEPEPELAEAVALAVDELVPDDPAELALETVDAVEPAVESVPESVPEVPEPVASEPPVVAEAESVPAPEVAPELTAEVDPPQAATKSARTHQQAGERSGLSRSIDRLQANAG